MKNLFTLKELIKITDVANEYLAQPMHYVQFESLLNPKNGFRQENKLTIPPFITKKKKKIVLDINNIL